MLPLKYAVLGRHFSVPLLAVGIVACGSSAERRGATVLFASGADLQSINPLLTVHPLARQVQRYVLLTTLARYDSSMTPQPYLARSWRWSQDHRTLALDLQTGVRWHDGRPTTARDVAWTLNAARDPATGYPRQNEMAAFDTVIAPDDSSVVVRFREARRNFPDLLTDLAILPSHLFSGVKPADLRQAGWNRSPIGNGPFRFVSHEANRRWVFSANRSFPLALGGPPRLERFIVVVVNEPTTKLAALTSGELDFAGIQPAHAEFVRQNPALAVLTYPLLWTDAMLFNTRRPPFDQLGVRRAVSSAIDRKELVDGYIYGFGTPAVGPVPPTAPGYVPVRPPAIAPVPISTGSRTAFELLTVGSGEAALEQMLQARLKSAGFDVTLRQLELSAFLARVYGRSHDFQAAVLGLPGDLDLGYLGPLASLAGVPVPSDPRAAQQVIADSVPAAFLYHPRGLQGVNRRVHGVTMDLRGELPTVQQWWVGR